MRSGIKPQRGWRDCADIIKAAEAQGWRIRQAGDSHLRLTPPDPNGVPVGIAGTPSDPNQRHQVIRLMRRSGLVWPVDTNNTNNNNQEEKVPSIGDLVNNNSSVTEMWRPLDHCSVAEISNGGRVRKATTGKIIEPDGEGMITLTDDRGRVRTQSVRTLCYRYFGHGPIKNVVPETVTMGHRASEVAAILTESEPDAACEGQVDNQEESTMATAVEVDVSTNGHASEGRWEPVLIEGIAEGYEVNEAAEVMAPKTPKLHTRTMLKPNQRAGGNAVYVNLRQVEGGRYRTVRLDEVVLEAFSARPSAEHIPEHRDGDQGNCVRANLAWALPENIAVGGEGTAAPAPEVDVPVSLLAWGERLPALRKRLAEQGPARIAIEDLDLTVRTYNLLSRNYLRTVAEIVQQRPVDFLEMRNFGEASIDELRGKLADLGLTLQPDPVYRPPGVLPAEEPMTPEAEQHQRNVERGKKSAATRAANKAKGKKKAAPTGVIRRLRIYELDGLRITVDAEGRADVSKAKNLSPTEVAALASLAVDVTEMNKLMGLA